MLGRHLRSISAVTRFYTHGTALSPQLGMFAGFARDNPTIWLHCTSSAEARSSVRSRKMPDYKFNLTVGELLPILND
jgi:hypothetical protein